MTTACGRTRWAIAGGHVPLRSTGPEPAMTSHDRLCILNRGDADADVAMTFFYADVEPRGPYRLQVDARRVRHVRVNDLIDREALPLDTPYGCVIESTVPVVVQFGRRDTGARSRAIAGGVAYPARSERA